MNPQKLLAKARNNPDDVRFSDFSRLLSAFGFTPSRTTGSYRNWTHPRLPRPFTVQPRSDGKAKAYQVRQLLDAIERFDPKLEDEARMTTTRSW